MNKAAGKKPGRIAVNLTLRISAVLLAVFVVMIFLIVGNIKKDLTSRELDKLELLANENADIAASFMETMLDKQSVVIAAVKSMQSLEEQQRPSYLNSMITQVKSQESNILSLFYVAEPNTFIKDSPNGFSIFATEKGTQMKHDQYAYVDKTLYQAARDGKRMVIVDPFQKKVDGVEYTVMTVLQPIIDANDTVVGMVGSNIDSSVLNNAAYNNGGFESFTNQIICGHQTVIINSANPGAIGKKFIDVSISTNAQMILDSAVEAKACTFLDTDTSGDRDYRAFKPFYVGDSKTPWLSGTSISEEEFNAQILAQMISMGLIATVGFLVLVCFCYISIRKTLKPIAALENAAHEMALGHLGVTITTHTNDELGRLGESFNESAETLSFYISEIDRAMESMSNGDFDVYPSRPFQGDFAGIEASILKFTQQMSSTLAKINTAANCVASGSQQVSSGSVVLSEGASEQACSVDQLTATINEISEQVRTTAERARSASGNAVHAGDQLDITNARMQELTTAIHEISASSNEISRIIKTIQDIAFQTNILALNAAVEAARAGVAGKGFAVVADEVRNLASKSADAAQNTTQLIEHSVRSVSGGVKAAADAAASLEGVLVSAHAVVANMDEISKACAEQAESVSQVTAGAEQISSVIQTNSATAEESAAASEELSTQALLLEGLVSKFRLRKDVVEEQTTKSTINLK